MTNSCTCVLMMWSDCGCSLGEGVIFIIAKDRKLAAIFCNLLYKSCVDFDFTYLAIHMIQKFVIQGCPTLIYILGVKYIINFCIFGGDTHFLTRPIHAAFSTWSSVRKPVSHQSTRVTAFSAIEHFVCRNCALLWPVSGCCVVVLP